MAGKGYLKILGIRVGGIETDLFSAAEPCLPSEVSVRSAETHPPADTSVRFAETRPPAETSIRLAETRLPSEVSFSGSLWCWGYLKLKLQAKQICLALTRGGRRWREAGGGAPTLGSRAGVRPRLRPRIRSGAGRRCSRCQSRACAREFGGHIRATSGLGSR